MVNATCDREQRLAANGEYAAPKGATAQVNSGTVGNAFDEQAVAEKNRKVRLETLNQCRNRETTRVNSVCAEDMM